MLIVMGFNVFEPQTVCLYVLIIIAFMYKTQLKFIIYIGISSVIYKRKSVCDFDS